MLAEIVLLKKSLLCKAATIDYFHLISGADFPCKSNDEIDRYFEEHKGKSYMWFDSDEETKEWRKRKYPDRYRLYHFNDTGYNNSKFINAMRPFIRTFQRFHIYLRPEIKNVYAGWNWFSWHRKVVDYTLRYLVQYPEKLNRMRYCTCIDEIFFHTLLHDKVKELNIVTNNALRYIDWHPNNNYKGSLPKILDITDYNMIKNSDAIFCRKVDDKLSKSLLTKLDKEIRS